MSLKNGNSKMKTTTYHRVSTKLQADFHGLTIKNKIQKLLKKVEKKHKVKILFAVEAGSRVWRIASKDSDYDVRFVFYHPSNEYLRLSKPIEVIETQEGDIDLVGFDIYKFTKLMLTSNPSTLEWIKSDMIYYGEIPRGFKMFAYAEYNPIALYHHYKSMCRDNYLKYIKSGNLVSPKKYLYCMRGLVNSLLVSKNIIPLVDFEKTLRKIHENDIVMKYKAPPILPANIHQELFNIICIKRAGREKQMIKNIKIFDKFIESFLDELHDVPIRKISPEIYEEIEKFIINTIQ